MTSTSVTVPNWPKYSRNFSGVVCQDSPPTKSLPGAESEPDPGVDRPDEEPFWLVPEPPLPGTTTVEPGTDPADPTTPVPSLPTAKRAIDLISELNTLLVDFMGMHMHCNIMQGTH